MQQYSNELLYNIFCFLNRQELELLCIVSRNFYNLIQKHFSSAPYRFFEQLTTAFEETHYLTVNPSSYICKEFLLKYGSKERGVSHPIADHALNWNESVGSIDLTHVVAIMTSQLLRTIKVGSTSIDIAADRFDEERKNMLRSIAPIWRHDVRHSLRLCGTWRISQSENDLVRDLLSCSDILLCDFLRLEFFVRPLELLCLNKYLVLYECYCLELAEESNCLRVEDLVDFLHAIPPHRQNKLVIKWTQRKNKECSAKANLLINMCQEIFKVANSAHDFKLLISLSNWVFRTYISEDEADNEELETLVPFQLHNSTTGELLRLDGINGEPEYDDHYDDRLKYFYAGPDIFMLKRSEL